MIYLGDTKTHPSDSRLLQDPCKSRVCLSDFMTYTSYSRIYPSAFRNQVAIGPNDA